MIAVTRWPATRSRSVLVNESEFWAAISDVSIACVPVERAGRCSAQNCDGSIRPVTEQQSSGYWGGGDHRLDRDRQLEAQRLRHLADRIVAFLIVEHAADFVFARLELLLEPDRSGGVQVALVNRIDLVERGEAHRGWLRHREVLRRYDLAVEDDGGRRQPFALRQRLAVDMPSGGDLNVEREGELVAAERARRGKRDPRPHVAGA